MGLNKNELIIEQLSIAVVNRHCQLRCIHCPAQDIRRPSGFLQISLIESLLYEASPRIVNLQGYGEPSLHPDFISILRLAKEGGRFVKFFSNLQGWSPTLAEAVVRLGIDQVIVSVDAFDEERYSAIRRGGSLQNLKHNLQTLLAARKYLGTNSPELIWNCIIMFDTVDQIYRASDFALEMGTGQPVFELLNDYGIPRIAKLATIHPQKVRDGLIATRIQAVHHGWERTIQNIDFNIASLKPVNNHRSRCLRPWRVLTVTEDGVIVPCGEFHDHQVTFGDLNRSSLHEIWEGQFAMAFRKRLLEGRTGIPVCSSCTVNEGATSNLFEDPVYE